MQHTFTTKYSWLCSPIKVLAANNTTLQCMDTITMNYTKSVQHGYTGT